MVKKDIFQGQQVYVVENSEAKHLLFDESLGLKAIINNGITEKEYSPVIHLYDWPLSIGKSWDSTGTMKTPTGSINIAAKYEIKGYGKVRVPAGTFDAYYILGKNDTGRIRIVEIWYSPQVKYYVKAVTYSESGRIVEELESYNHAIEDLEQGTSDIGKKIEKLKELLEKGLITKEEFDNKKSELLRKF